MRHAGADGTMRQPVLRRAPLVLAAVAMTAGIVAGRYLTAPLGVWAAAGIASLLAGAIALRREHLRPISIGGIAGAIFSASAAAAALRYHRVPADHIVTFSQESSILATLRGRVLSQPQVSRSQTAFWLPPRTTFLLEAGAIRSGEGQWLATRGRLRVSVAEPLYELQAGEQVELIGSLRRPLGPTNPGHYDWPAADRYRGILVRFAVPGADGVNRLGAPGRGLLAGAVRRLRSLVRNHLAGCGQPEDAMLLEALVQGERDPALQALNRTMAEAGVAHFLSISGLHLGIFLGFVYWLFRAAMFPPRRAAIVVLGVLVAYVLLAEPRAPLLRGAVMAAAFCIAAISGRAVTTSNALAAAAIVLLLIDPLQLFTPAFQLSFGIVCGIVVFYRPLRQLLFGPYLRRRGLIVFRTSSAGQRLWRWLHYRGADWMIRLVCLSAAAYATAVPLVAYHFGLFSPYAPLLSIVLLPLMTMVLVPAYVSMALAWPMPNLAAGIGELAAAMAAAMRQNVLGLARLPGLSVEVFPLPVWWVVLAYAAAGLWLLAGRRRGALPAALAASAAVLAVLAVTQRAAPARGQLHVLDVGHGAMTLLHGPDGKTYLFDAGSAAGPSPYHQTLRPFLRACRLPAPEAVFISHANLDHYNAVADLLEHRPPRRVYLNEIFGSGPDEPPMVRQLMEKFARHRVEVIRLRRGQEVQLGQHSRVEVLWPRPAAEAGGLDVNDSSLVLRVTCGRRSVLLPGDAGEAVEAPLSKLPPERIRSDVMLLPHHGSVTPTLASFIEAVGAELLLQSSEFHYDSAELAEALGGRKRYATFRHGWIAVGLAGERLSVETMRRE